MQSISNRYIFARKTMQTKNIRPLLKTIFPLIFLMYSPIIQAQVTIGYNEAPVDGALLQLKSSSNVTGANADKGLMLPRVKLLTTQLDESKYIDLSQTIEGATGTWNKKTHIGLLVYNVNDNGSDICPGPYVWNGNEWNKLNKPCLTFNISPTSTIYFPSGTDLRSLQEQNITVNWNSSTGEVSFIPSENNIAQENYNPLNFNVENAFFPSLSSLKAGQELSILPMSMEYAEVNDTNGNPFLTKESKFSLILTDNGVNKKSNEILLNQTNKSILSDGKYTPKLVQKYVSGESEEIIEYQITSNARWKIKEAIPALNTGKNAISLIEINGTNIDDDIQFDNTVNGIELENGKGGEPVSLKITINQNNENKNVYSKLVLGDTQTPARFADLVYNIYQCTGYGASPTMSQWAEIAGYPNVKDKEEYLSLYKSDPIKAEEEDRLAKIGDINPQTGISWHRDQDGNIFLAASFNAKDFSKNRWMITNLSATKYANGITNPNGELKNVFNSSNAFNTPYYVYPTSKSNTLTDEDYIQNPRLGVLYTWSAATAGKGGANGNLGINDGANPAVIKVQGICPDGWYLPSDADYTDLENEIINNTKLYSQLESTGSSTLSYTVPGGRGVRLGKAMEDFCQDYKSSPGKSNTINSVYRPGFGAIFAGNGYFSSVTNYNNYAFFWTSSGNGNNFAWIRYMYNNNNLVYRNYDNRSNLFSVRCIQDVN